jgi:hypothetical protein
MLRRLTLTATFAITCVIAGATPGTADPGNGHGQTTFPMVCDGKLSALTVGGGSWAAADLGDSHGTFIPQQTYFSIHDGSGELLYEEHDAKRGGGKPSTSSCVDEFEMDGLHYRFVVEGKVKGTPAVD